MHNHFVPPYLRTLLLSILLVMHDLSIAQSPESFFPPQVGNRWDYAYWNGGFFEFYSHVITRDSTGSDNSRYLFYNASAIPRYKIDSSRAKVFWLFPACTYFLYDLQADSGYVWENLVCSDRYAWVARKDSGVVFSQPTVIKQYEYGPVHPDSGPQPYALVKRWLASRFGLIYEWQEPGVFSTLVGCIVAGDTFGTLVSVPERKEELSTAFTLRQNYPNPFNPTTTIEIDLPEASIVSVKVYDVIGRQVATIVEGKTAPGVHRFLWDATSLPSGVYFGRMQGRANIQTIKMVLMR